jgi:hypothetical protein
LIALHLYLTDVGTLDLAQSFEFMNAPSLRAKNEKALLAGIPMLSIGIVPEGLLCRRLIRLPPPEEKAYFASHRLSKSPEVLIVINLTKSQGVFHVNVKCFYDKNSHKLTGKD